MSHDVVADTLNMIMNVKRAGKKELVVKRYSKLLLNVLEIAKTEGYIQSYDINEREKKLKIKIGKLNNCQAIKPRFFVTVQEIEKYVRRFLPARNFGIIIVSTNKGLLTQAQAYEEKNGGSLIAYFY
jgi:small subunit ribosomal protein S8